MFIEWSNLESVRQITGIISQLAIFVAVLSLFFQFWQSRKAKELSFKNNFITCTARYTKIQELLLANEDLADLSDNIYKKTPLPDLRDLKSVRKELALCGMMFQLMEDVWMIHDFDKHSNKDENKDTFTGWNKLFTDWMKAEAVWEKWDILSSHYCKRFRDFAIENYRKAG